MEVEVEVEVEMVLGRDLVEGWVVLMMSGAQSVGVVAEMHGEGQRNRERKQQAQGCHI